MKKKANEEAVVETTEKKRPGRRPMTAAEKAAAAKLRAAEKEKASQRKTHSHLKPQVFVQYQSAEVDVSALEEAAKAEFHSVKKRALVTELRLYVKPEERMAYYVINGSHEGSIPF